MAASVGSWDGILTMILFILTNAVILFPLNIHICLPQTLTSNIRHKLVVLGILNPSVGNNEEPGAHLSWVKLHVDHQVAPVAAVLLLLATTAIEPSVVKTGITGADGVNPLDIMALFISLAYLSISLDAIGLLRYLAFKVARKGSASGRRLYLYLYLFFLVAALIVGNDPVVLSGTAFLAYFTRVAGIVPPTAWTYSQFAAANIASAVLPPSNPTNLIITSAFSIPFTKFAAHTVIPVLISAIFIYPLMTQWLFHSPRSLIPHRIDVDVDHVGPINDQIPTHQTTRILEERRPRAPRPDEVSNKVGATLGSVLLIGTLVVLVATSPLPRPIPVWRVTVPPALIMLGYDVWSDVKNWKPTNRTVVTVIRTGDEDGGIELDVLPEVSSGKRNSRSNSLTESGPHMLVDRRNRATLQSLLENLTQRLPTIATLFPRLPFSLVPFALSMFVLVNSLASKGWVEVFASWWMSWISFAFRSGGEKGAVVGAAGLLVLLSVLLCNVCGTNIGATILLARILKLWVSSSSPSPRILTVSIYTLAIGSNFGAFSFHPGASLAGLLWRDILRRKGIVTHTSVFARANVCIVAVAMTVGTGIIIAQVYVTS